MELVADILLVAGALGARAIAFDLRSGQAVENAT